MGPETLHVNQLSVMWMLLDQGHPGSSEVQTSGHPALHCLRLAGFSAIAMAGFSCRSALLHLLVTPPKPPPEDGIQKEDTRMRLHIVPLVLEGLLWAETSAGLNAQPELRVWVPYGVACGGSGLYAVSGLLHRALEPGGQG